MKKMLLPRSLQWQKQVLRAVVALAPEGGRAGEVPGVPAAPVPSGLVLLRSACHPRFVR